MRPLRHRRQTSRRGPNSKGFIGVKALSLLLPLDVENCPPEVFSMINGLAPDWRLKNILAPIDFSACSAHALARAAALARSHDATLTILHVIDINPPAARTHCGTAENLMRKLWITGVSELCRLRELLAQNQIKTQTLIVEGLPVESIVENSPGFDLLVMGERRSRSAWNLFSRHTARRVIERAECPVQMVHQNNSFAGRELEPKANCCSVMNRPPGTYPSPRHGYGFRAE